MHVKTLQEVEGQRRLAIVFSSGEEMVRGLTDMARAQQISNAHFTGIGALRAGILGYFDVTRREYRRFGIDEHSDHTLEEIGGALTVTRERVRQIEAKALAKLRHSASADLLRACYDA